MPIQVKWFNTSKTIILQSYHTPWTWDNYHASAKEIDQMLDSVDYPVDLIVDFSDGAVLPAKALSHFRRAVMDIHPNRGLVVMVGMNPYLAALQNVLEQMVPHSAARSRIAETLDEAIAIINAEGASRYSAAG